MNLHLEPQGFLGTGASLLSDLSLLAYILLIVPGILAGWVFARRGLYRPHHKYLMITITVVNWLLIIFLMLASYRHDIAANITEQTGNTRYLIPTIHALLGLPAQLLATYIIIGMVREDAQVARAKARGEQDLQKYWFKNAKTKMRITLVLWLATAAFGIITYLFRYEVLPNMALQPVVSAPVATEEIPAPQATDEIIPLEATEAVQTTPEVTAEVIAPVATEELMQPAATLDVEASEDAAEDQERASRDATRAAEDATKAAEDDD